jgi:dipeptidyl aminopeptidase/acylaminoacyl peptidase
MVGHDQDKHTRFFAGRSIGGQIRSWGSRADGGRMQPATMHFRSSFVTRCSNQCGWRLALLALALGTPCTFPLHATEDYAPFFAPMRVSQATLAPDGRHVAYVIRYSAQTIVAIVDIDLGEMEKTVPVPGQTGRIASAANVDSLTWPDARHLVIASNRQLVQGVELDSERETRLSDEDVAVRRPRRSRSLRVLDQLPDASGTVYVEAQGSLFAGGRGDIIPTTLFQLEVATGRRKQVGEGDAIGYLLYDQQAHARILQASPMKRTQTFQYSARSKGWGRWKDLDRFLGSSELVFQVTVENYYGGRSFPLAFDYDPNVLYFASNVGRDTYGLYALNLRTKRRTAFVIEDSHCDLALPDAPRAFARSLLIFDRYRRRLAGVRLAGDQPRTRWFDDGLAAVQAELGSQFPQRQVELLGWDEARQRYLVLVTSASDPGRYYIFRRRERLAVELARRMPWLTADELHRTEDFAFDSPAGTHLRGYLTFPSQARITPPPLVVLCHDGPWSREEAAYNADAQALAAMGLTVLRVNYRGSSGFGTTHRNAIRGHLDGPPVEDLAAAVDWVVAHYPVDQKRIALFGEQFGGYLALRTLQMHPKKFRCAVTINAPTQLARWFIEPELKNLLANAGAGAAYRSDRPVDSTDDRSAFSYVFSPPRPVDFMREAKRAAFNLDNASLDTVSPLQHAEDIAVPLFLIHTPDRDIGSWHGLVMRDRLRQRDVEVDYWELDADYPLRQPQGRAELFARIEEFFNLHLYDYSVKLGTPIPVPE